ncbi:MAG: GNAT family N-acetyltransferase [Pelagimonas sp.]
MAQIEMIETIPEMALIFEDEAQIVGLLEVCFPTDFGGRSFYMQRPHHRVIWREDERILGHMALFNRVIRLDDELVSIVGLGDVAAHPDARGRGIGAQLLERSIALSKASNADYFLLFGTRSLYSALGFRTVKNHYRYVDMTGSYTGHVGEQESNCLMVLELGETPWPESAKLDLLGHLF